jgi:protein gp37
MLGPVDLCAVKIPGATIDSPRLKGVIVGCESGPGARHMNPDWARVVRDQCHAARVPFYLKQMMVDGKLATHPRLDGREWKELPHA